MNISRFFLSAIALFVAIFFFEWLFHGYLLTETYQQTSDLWRSDYEMQVLFPYSIGSVFIFALAVAFLFTRFYEGRGLAEGLRFGLILGVLLGIVDARTYFYLPIPLFLAVIWFAGSVVKGLLMGAILSLTYKE